MKRLIQDKCSSESSADRWPVELTLGTPIQRKHAGSMHPKGSVWNRNFNLVRTLKLNLTIYVFGLIKTRSTVRRIIFRAETIYGIKMILGILD